MSARRPVLSLELHRDAFADRGVLLEDGEHQRRQMPALLFGWISGAGGVREVAVRKVAQELVIFELKCDVGAVERSALCGSLHLFDEGHLGPIVHRRRIREDVLENHVDGNRLTKLEASKLVRIAIGGLLDAQVRRRKRHLSPREDGSVELRRHLYIDRHHGRHGFSQRRRRLSKGRG